MTTKRSSIIYLASHNPHKIAELAALLGAQSFELRSLAELSPPLCWEETGTTFRENAMIKILAASQRITEALLAEDSGLEVAALDGAPGVYSSSYAGVEGDHPGNLRKLLQVMQGLPRAERRARFVCTLLYREPLSGNIASFVGSCEGEILEAPRGEQGFGYDAVFMPQGQTQTMAELSRSEKNRLSHRAQAFAAWLSFMNAL